MTTTLKSPNPKIGNSDLYDQLSEIDYRSLKEKNFEKYNDIVLGKLEDPENKLEGPNNRRSGGLAATDIYDFEAYRVSALKKELYPGMKDTPIIIIGVKLEKDTPEIPSTRITIGHAINMNSQLGNFDGRVPGLYFLIKKVKAIEEEEEKDTKNKIKK